MRKLIGRHTRGSDKPRYILMVKDDWRYLRDKHSEEYDLWEPRFGGPTFNGIKIVISDLAEKGSPLVVMAEPDYTAVDPCMDDMHRGTECKCCHVIYHCCSHHCCCFDKRD